MGKTFEIIKLTEELESKDNDFLAWLNVCLQVAEYRVDYCEADEYHRGTQEGAVDYMHEIIKEFEEKIAEKE